MRGKLFAFVAALLLTVTAGSWAQQSGGFPSRPRFQSVGIGTAPLAGTGNLRATGITRLGGATGTVFGTAQLNVSNSTAAYLELSDNGTRSTLLGADAGGGFIGTFSNHDFAIRTNNVTRISVSSGGTTTLEGQLNLNGSTTRNIAFTPFGAGGVQQNGIQWFTDNNLYIDSASTGTPTGGAINFRTGPSTQVRLNIAADGATTLNGLRIHAGAGTFNGAFACSIEIASTVTPSVVGGNCPATSWTPSVSRTSTGVFVITHNLGASNGFTPVCMTRDNGGVLRHVIGQSTTSTTFTVHLFSSAGALTDGGNIWCVLHVR
jgi:hypothetical protein